ncbi:unnamed protein product [Phaeothamnion confervicola]
MAPTPPSLVSSFPSAARCCGSSTRSGVTARTYARMAKGPANSRRASQRFRCWRQRLILARAALLVCRASHEKETVCALVTREVAKLMVADHIASVAAAVAAAAAAAGGAAGGNHEEGPSSSRAGEAAQTHVTGEAAACGLSSADGGGRGGGGQQQHVLL